MRDFRPGSNDGHMLRFDVRVLVRFFIIALLLCLARKNVIKRKESVYSVLFGDRASRL